MILRLIALLACVSAAASASAQIRVFQEAEQVELRQRFGGLMQRLDGTQGGELYVAQQLGTPLVIAGFTLGNDQTRSAMLRATVQMIEKLPRLRDIGSVAASNTMRQQSGPGDMRFDGLPLPSSPSAISRRVFPMRDSDSLKIASGNAQQFAYLLSTILRLAAEAPPPKTGTPQWTADLATLHEFLIDDILRFYWLEAPAWHWTGALPNMRARTLARLGGISKFAPRKFFSAFIDYDLHVLAIAADLSAVHRRRPTLVRSNTDRLLVDDAVSIGMRVLKARVDRGTRGEGFAFDRGRWDDNPSQEYAGCVSDRPPVKPCRRIGSVQDVSHAQRWPLWLNSFSAAAKTASDRAQLITWRRGLARQFARSVVRYDSARRPRLSNFIDGTDGWYLFSNTPEAKTGYPPGSLTGWSMRHGNWALLATDDAAIGIAYRRFCDVIESASATDVAFRTKYYGAPGDPAYGYRSSSDEFGVSSTYVYICRLYAAQGLIKEK